MTCIKALAFRTQQEHRSLAQRLRYNIATLPRSERIAMPAEDVVRARIDKQVKAEAAEVLESMGLSLSDAIRLLLMRVAKDKALPFALKVPNAETREAIAELEAGRGERGDLRAWAGCLRGISERSRGERARLPRGLVPHR